MLLELTYYYKIVFVITSQLSRSVEKRKNRLPKIKDLMLIQNLFQWCRKCVVISRPAMYGVNEEDKLHYILYKDWKNSYFLQDKNNS